MYVVCGLGRYNIVIYIVGVYVTKILRHENACLLEFGR